MPSRSLRPLLACILVVTALAAPGGAATRSGSVVEAATLVDDSCFDGSDEVCSTTASASPDGAFDASVELSSPDSPKSRSVRYSIASARYVVGFDLASPAREVELAVTLQLDEAAASWTKDHLDIFSGTKSPSSGAAVSFILFGRSAPEGCGCGWPQVGLNQVEVVRASAGQSVSISDTTTLLTLTARNSSGGNLPAGHYTAWLRGHAIAQLVGTADWGSLSASVAGRIVDIRVTTPIVATSLTLSVDGSGSRRTLSALLTDSDANPISGRTVSFYSDRTFLGTATTVDGAAALPLQGRFRGGSHPFRAEFAGDESYEASFAETHS